MYAAWKAELEKNGGESGPPVPPTLVDANWLDTHLNDANVRVLDATFHMPVWNRNAIEEYTQCHIPGAAFFDITKCLNKNATYGAQMLPPAGEFEQYVSDLGIDLETHVVIYDNNANMGHFSAPRAWYMFKVFGHPKVSILSGGLPKWQAAGKQTTGDVTEKMAPKSPYKAALQSEKVKSYEDVLGNLEKKSFTLVDARPPGRFNGTAPEPNPAIKPGRIPVSVNLPFTQILNPETKEIKTPDELGELFGEKGLDFKNELVACCGTGLTAAFLVLAAHLCGKDVSLYDGSWMEWFQRADRDKMLDVPE